MRYLAVLATLLLVAGCTHKYESEEAKNIPFNPALVIHEPILIKNAYSEENKPIYEAMKESGYFPQLYREDDAPTKPAAHIVFDGKLEKENASNGLQKTETLISAMTLTAIPAYVTFDYTLNIGLYKDGTFYKRYKATTQSSHVVVALNSVRADEKSLVKQMLPEIAGKIKADLNLP